MNKYGTMLQRQWTLANPSFVQSLSDPRGHFTEMGEQVQAEIQEILPQLQGVDPVGERYLEKVGRINAALLQAEEIVLEQYQPPSDSSEEGELPEELDSMSHDEQEAWIRANLPAGERQDEELASLEARRATAAAMMSQTGDPENLSPDE